MMPLVAHFRPEHIGHMAAIPTEVKTGDEPLPTGIIIREVTYGESFYTYGCSCGQTITISSHEVSDAVEADVDALSDAISVRQ